MQRPRRAEYTPTDFIAFRESGTLDITPKFQRRGVWSQAQRSYFIDSLLRGMPVPPLYLRETQSPDSQRVLRQVIDGQQRLRTVIDFIDDKFAISRKMPGDWGGRRFSKLAAPEQEQVKNYHFSAEVFQGISDTEVLDIFARMNTYSIQLNAQELRNGKWFGFFKQSCYELAHEHIEFWRRHKIFTEQNIARMQEVELTSELLVLEMAGLQDKKKSLNNYYADFDEEFPSQRKYEDRFRATIDVIEAGIGSSLRDTQFRRRALFYTLFGAVYHWMYGLPNVGLKTPQRKPTMTQVQALGDSVLSLSDIGSLDVGHESIPRKFSRFVAASARQTDNIEPRRIRLETLVEEWRDRT